MSYNIILNSTNNIDIQNNSIYRYHFSNGNFKINENSEICVSQVQIPYSWYNISAFYSNNSFQFIDWLNVTRTITLPDGFYTIADIQNYLELYFINNGLYLINNGINVYYFSMYTNQTYYKNQFVFYNVPTSLPLGYTQPSNFIGYPLTTLAPQFVVLNNNFTIFSGFNAGIYGGGAFPTNVMSTNIPIGSTVNSLLISCNLVDNSVGFPSDILDIVQIDSSFGTNINYEPKFQKFVKIKPGTYNSLIINFRDQNNNQIKILDSNLTISLLLKTK
jgi:hypothetical protein